MDEFDSSPAASSSSTSPNNSSYCCPVEKHISALSLHSDELPITIIDAYKGHAPDGPSGNSGNFVSYGIKFKVRMFLTKGILCKTSLF